MKTKPNQADDEARNTFLAKAAGLWPVAKGSLTQTRSLCARKTCKECASGRKHPKLIFTFREEGRLKGLYVRPSQEKVLRQAIANGRELERLAVAAGRDLVPRCAGRRRRDGFAAGLAGLPLPEVPRPSFRKRAA